MAELFFRILRHLLPDARPWRIRWHADPADGRPIDQFFIALAGVFADVREFCDLAYLDLYVATTRLLGKHQQQFALRTSGDVDQDTAAVAAAWAATGGQSPAYLQSVVRAAGFDLYVHEWWGSGTPPRLFGDLLDGWWAVDPESRTVASGDVSSLQDLSPNGRDVASGGPSSSPTFVADAGPGLKRGVAFAEGAHTLNSDAFAYDTGSRVGFAVVGRWPEVPGSDDPFLSFEGPGGDFLKLWADVSEAKFIVSVQYEGGSAWEDVAGPALDAEWHLFEFYLLSTGWVFVVDGVEFASARTEGVRSYASGGATTFKLLTPGSHAQVREALVLNDEPNAEQQVALRNYFAHRYAPLGLPIVPRDPREYTSQPLIGSVQCGEPLALCGEPTALTNNFLANEVGYLVNQAGTPNAPPGIPEDPDFWPYFIYFGAQRFPAVANVAASRRLELYELLLKLCPDQHWIVLLIDFVDAASSLLQEDGDRILMEDGDGILLEV